MLTLHSLALAAVLTDGRHRTDRTHSAGIEVQPIGAAHEAPGSAYDTAKADLQAGRAVPALEGFRRAVREAPRSVDALNGLAVTYDLLGRFDQSSVYYEAALAVDSGAAIVSYNYGYSLYQQGEIATARRFLGVAAHSDDDEARGAARRLLQLLAEARTPPPAAIAPAARQSWIERSNDGEQRLVLDGPATPANSGAAPGEAAELALTTAATAWTDLDDARTEHAAHVEAVAFASAERVRAAAAVPQSDGAGLAGPTAAPPVPSQMLAAEVPPTVSPHARAGAVVVAVDAPMVLMRSVDLIPSPLAAAEARLRPAVTLGSPVRASAGPISSQYLLAAVGRPDPSRRRRAAVAVGGSELVGRLASSASNAVGEPRSPAFDRLSAILASFGNPQAQTFVLPRAAIERLELALGVLAGASA